MRNTWDFGCFCFDEKSPNKLTHYNGEQQMMTIKWADSSNRKLWNNFMMFFLWTCCVCLCVYYGSLYFLSFSCHWILLFSDWCQYCSCESKISCVFDCTEFTDFLLFVYIFPFGPCFIHLLWFFLLCVEGLLVLYPQLYFVAFSIHFYFLFWLDIFFHFSFLFCFGVNFFPIQLFIQRCIPLFGNKSHFFVWQKEKKKTWFTFRIIWL